MDSIFELATETYIDEVPESTFDILLEVLVPKADPILDGDTTCVLIVAICGNICRLSAKISYTAFKNSLFEYVPRTHSLFCRCENFFDSCQINFS